ncbi:MAG: hypothetical protein M1831_002405 [Alyxoria varia]|nr:MAG: hypothetical protein M1831_002405 [Alyxoria varia]
MTRNTPSTSNCDIPLRRRNEEPRTPSESRLHPLLNPSKLNDAVDKDSMGIQPEAKTVPPNGDPPSSYRRRSQGYAQDFCQFLSDNPTVFHAVSSTKNSFENADFQSISERQASWDLQPGGKYVLTRNGSSLVAFTVGEGYKPGNGIAMIAGHVDAITTRIKPFPKIDTDPEGGYTRLGVAPYASGLNHTWWDRDLSIAGRVIVKDASTGKVSQRLVDLEKPIARIPSLAEHFGDIARQPANKETQMLPIVGLDGQVLEGGKASPENEERRETLSGSKPFTATQPPKLVSAIAKKLNIEDHSTILTWELELYDSQPAQLGGFDDEFIFGGRIDDKLCSWAAVQGLLEYTNTHSVTQRLLNHPTHTNSTINLVALFDDEEIGSLQRQGARGNLLPSTVERIVQSLNPGEDAAPLLSQTYANSFLVSADVTHAYNPNFPSAYLPHHSPRLNTGVSITQDPNGHMTSNSISTAITQRFVEKYNHDNDGNNTNSLTLPSTTTTGSRIRSSHEKPLVLQTFQIRNDVRSGGTVGPMLSSKLGVRAIDVGLPQLSMHSIRATTGSEDPMIGVKFSRAVFEYWEGVREEFEGAED